jgi:chemotaxis protein MotB
MGGGYKKRRRRGDHGVDDWLMTYADMITLLLCFFCIFLSVSVPKSGKFEQAREKVLEHFAAPDQVQGRLIPKHDMAGNPQSNTNADALPSIVDRFHEGEGRSIGPGVDAGEGHSAGMGEGPDRGTSTLQTTSTGQSTNNGQTNMLPDAAQQPQNGQHPGGQQGDRIKTLEMPSAAFFDSGSAALKDDGKKLLQEIMVTQLDTDEFKDYQVTIEGHTDDVPINTLQFPSNWELSTARAAAVVRYLIDQGMPAQRLRAAGYADTFPKVPNRDEAGNMIPANQAQNRRVVIKMEKIEKAN